MSKIYLGRVRRDHKSYLSGENCYLTKHQWCCGWYWGFGYIGNSQTHTHFDSTFLQDYKYASEIFETTNISDADWWVIRDLFVQAYALRKAAEVYRYGGHQTSREGLTDLIRDSEMAARLNNDLDRVLERVWAFTVEAIKVKEPA
jgi:hypothetical protein